MNAVQYTLILAIRVYRWTISPAKTFLFGPLGQCRFTPSCSAYALEAIARHGAFKGTWLALKRIGRCHPWGGCGEDPVPARKSEIRNPKSEIGGQRREPDPGRNNFRAAQAPGSSAAQRVRILLCPGTGVQGYRSLSSVCRRIMPPGRRRTPA